MAAVETKQNQQGPSIDKLLDFFVANDGTAYYKVKWKPTWERADALSHFNDLVDRFWKFVNNAHDGNLSNNQSMHKGPDPDLPPAPDILNQTYQQLPNQTYQQIPNNDVQPVQKQKAAPRKRQKPNPQHQNIQSIPQPQQNRSNVAQQQQRLSAPIINNTFPEVHTSTVIIDSDDEDLSELPNLSSIQNVPGMGAMQIPMQQQQHNMSPMWNMQPKMEPSELPDQKPFQGNQQQQQFQFPMQQQQQNFNTNNGNGRGNNNNVRGRGSGRGRGGTPGQGAKRKQSIPSAAPTKQQQPPVQHGVKMETPDDMTFLNSASPNMVYDASDDPSDDNPGGGKWEDNFEIIEKKNFDGTKLETLYKCTICGTVISNKSSCRRHFNIHSGEKSHKCPICQKAFHRIDYMQRHLKIHGQGSGQELESLIKLAIEGSKK